MNRRWLALLMALLLVGLSLVVFGCNSSEQSAPQTAGDEEAEAEQEDAEDADEDEDEDEGEIILTVYFAQWTDVDAFLVPVEREVPATEQVARAAIEELIEGPDAGSPLRPVIPATVEILSITIENGVCSLDLSEEILTDSGTVGVSATTEGLLLGAIANTLTEFPTITKVKLSIEGKTSGNVAGYAVEDFWGHVGLPAFLEREPSLIAPD